MSDPTLTLFHFPGACSRVTVCALEMANLVYTLELVNLSTGAQLESSYKSVSPLGKVPALIIDGQPLTENSAILTYIAALRPESGIFPENPTPRGLADAAAGLSFCSGTLHPQIRGIANPQRITAGEGGPVRERSVELATKSFAYADWRLADRGWWLGDLSIVDVYLDWAFAVARKAGFDSTNFPNLDALELRLADQLPAYVRMQAEEQRSRDALNL